MDLIISFTVLTCDRIWLALKIKRRNVNTLSMLKTAFVDLLIQVSEQDL